MRKEVEKQEGKRSGAVGALISGEVSVAGVGRTMRLGRGRWGARGGARVEVLGMEGIERSW